MIVYADILIVVNLIVDYLLLKAVSLILCSKAKTWRLVISAIIGGFSSLYIFIPNGSLIFEGLFKIFICIFMSIIAFGYGNFKHFFKASGILFIITCGYAGAMMAIWNIFKPNGMIVNNGVVYFNISPLILIVCTVASYFIFILLYKIFARTAKTAESCEVELLADGKTERFCGILDTGNSIVDVFGKSEIIIADESVLKGLFGETDISKNQQLSNRYRLVPCSTVSGNEMLEAFRCDEASVSAGDRKTVLDKPIVAISKTKINDGYSAVLNPKIFQ